jgi:hypothetical protein
MFVSKLYTDNWTGNRNEENFIENPNWQQIKTAICELDGNTKTLVSLEVDDESYMMIGGGNAGKYIVTATLDNEVFYSLLYPVNYEIAKSDVYAKNNSVNSDNEPKLIVGGQAGNYAEKVCVNLPQCLIAAITFTESGKLESLFFWEED